MRSTTLASLALGLALSAAAGASAASFAEGRSAFTVRARGESISYRVFALYALPGEALEVSIFEPAWRQGARLVGGWAGLRPVAPGSWRGWAPTRPGLYPVRVESRGEAVTLHLFVTVPAGEVRDGRLRGYRIGDYPEKPFRGLSSYRPPPGFVEVTAANADAPVSPHFTLGQFVCKQEGGPPRYVVLRERLLLKLERLLALVNGRGIEARTFFVMSGYRTPVYNAAIGNVRFSRHQYGDAADVFVDESPRDGVMDDLNRDGRIDRADADFLYDLIDGLSRREGAAYGSLLGGLGSYGTTPAHGPFVHVDARGFRARWGR